jgi:hypothetical protein
MVEAGTHAPQPAKVKFRPPPIALLQEQLYASISFARAQSIAA